MSSETELKYTPHNGFFAKELFECEYIAPYAGLLRRISMSTEYLDTKDRLAAKSGITLRRRYENGESVIYAKTNKSSHGALSVRGEWSVASEDTDVAARLLCNVGAPVEELCDLPLVTVASVRFERLECLVTPYPGFSFMLSYDEGVFGEKLPFSEVELELCDGSVSELTVFGEKLASRLGLTPETRSKYARALSAPLS
ncbi:MAG: CYTH domain-containing protein [Oscillospiraceae bacterium]|nr:CYTH domain-containing protein [Oscillospiraceae bacterium]